MAVLTSTIGDQLANQQQEQRRQDQCDAARSAASILALPGLPDVGSLIVDYSGALGISLLDDCLDRTRLELHQFAAVLDDAKWSLEPHLNGRKKAQVTGTHRGAQVEVWNLLHIPDSVTLADLAASPKADAPAETRQAEVTV